MIKVDTNKLDEVDWQAIQACWDKTAPFQLHPCPNCGRCPICGRGGYRADPFPHNPPNPHPFPWIVWPGTNTTGCLTSDYFTYTT